MTHNLQQARRISDDTAFLDVHDLANGSRTGCLFAVERRRRGAGSLRR